MQKEWTPGRVLQAMRALAPELPADLPPDLAAAARRYFGGPGRAALCAGVPVERIPRPWLRTRGALALAAAQLHLRLTRLQAVGLGHLRQRARRLGLRWSDAVAEGLRLREEYPVRPLLDLPAAPPPVVSQAAPPTAARVDLPPSPVPPWVAQEAGPWPAAPSAPPGRPDLPIARSRPVRWAGRLHRQQAAALATPENLPLFLAELDHPHPGERQCAMVLAAATGDERAAGPLEARLRHETDHALLGTLLEALGWAGARGRDAVAAAARQPGQVRGLALRTLYAASADPGRRAGVLTRLAELAADPTLPEQHRARAGQALAEWGWISREESAATGLSADPVGREVLEAWRSLHGAPLISRRFGWERIATPPALAFFHPHSIQESSLRAEARLEALEEDERARIAHIDAELLERERVLAARARVGRNDPCPCGSNAKFKKCCGSGERSPLDAWVSLRGRPGIPLTAMRVPPYGQPESPHLLQAVQDPRNATLRPPPGATPFHRWFLACRAASLQQEALLMELALGVLAGWGEDDRLDYVRVLHSGFGPLQRIAMQRLEPVVDRIAEAGCASAIYLMARLLALREDRWQLLPRLGDPILARRAHDGDALAAWLIPTLQAPGVPPTWILPLRDRLAQPTTTGATLEDLRLLVDEAVGLILWLAQPIAPPPKSLTPEQAPWLFHPWEGAAALHVQSQRVRLARFWLRQPLPERPSEDSAEPIQREAAARKARVEALQHLYAKVRQQAGEHEVEVVRRLGDAAFYGAEREALNLLLPRSGPRVRSLALAAAVGRLAAELGLSLRALDFRGGRPALRLQGEQDPSDTEEQGLMVTAQEVAAELGVEPAPLYNLLLGELDAYAPSPEEAFTVPSGRLAAEAAHRELHPWRLAFDLGRQGEPLSWWLEDLDPEEPLGAGERTVPEATRPPRPEDDPDELRRSLRRACRRTLRQGKIGESHTAFDHLMKGIPKHLRGEAREFFEALATAGLLRDKPTHYGRQISIEPRAVPLIERFVEDGTVPEAVRRAFAVREADARP